jgi:Cof subfamily protein (haloacid dehalogenase superfamily)
MTQLADNRRMVSIEIGTLWPVPLPTGQLGIHSNAPASNIRPRLAAFASYNGFMPIRMIAMDLDGTLLNSSSQVSEQNARTIGEAAERGIEIVLVTGRRYDFARPVAERLPCELHLIACNGALIKSMDGATHYRTLLPSETARVVLRRTREFREFTAVVFDRPKDRQIIMERINWDDPLRGSYFRKSRDFLAIVDPLEDCLDGPGPKEDPIQVAFSGNIRTMRAVYATLEKLPNAAEFTLALTEYEKRDLSILDVLRRGVTKAQGLEKWAAKRGIRREEIMAIGDNWNDREMLEFAGFPVVMGNGLQELKTRGWAVTLSNDEHGVAEAIRKYALAEQEVGER